MNLIAFEVRQWLKRPILYAACLVIALFVITQIGDSFFTEAFSWPETPRPELEAAENQLAPYGYRIDTSAISQMQGLAREVYLAAHGNPVSMPALGGFINRQVQLSDAQRLAAQSAFLDLTGVAYDTLNYYDDFPTKLPYDAFMLRVDALNAEMGGGFFVPNPLVDGDVVPKTYEEALADYDTMLREDRYTRAMARYYCDYMGIALGIFPVFLAAFSLAHDKRSGAAEAIGSRPISGVHYVLVKYLGTVIPLCLFVMLVACLPTIGAVLLRGQGHNADVFSYLTYSVTWLFPTVLAVSALSMFVAEIFGSGIVAIPAVIGWWMLSVPRFHGPYPIYLSIIRFNSTDAMDAAWAAQIAANRMSITILAALLVLFTGLLFERKRARGGRYA